MIELFTMGSPSPRKVSIMLEEVGVPYVAHWVNVYAGEHLHTDFLNKNPNGRLPAMIDHAAPDGPLLIWESAAMLIYLAEKTGQLLPLEGPQRYEVLKWATFQATHAPYLGNAHWYRLFAPKPERYSIDRFTTEAGRIYALLNVELAGRPYIAGKDYSIADISFFPWIEYHAWQGQELSEYPNLSAWFQRVGSRSAVERGRRVPYSYTEFGDSPESEAFRSIVESRIGAPDWTPSSLTPHAEVSEPQSN